MNVQDAIAFLAVARMKSFSKAASYLNVAQSALSRRVQRLEHDTRHSLLVRTAKGVELTHAGRVLFEKVERLQREIEQIQQTMLDLREGPEVLRVAIPHGAMRLFGPSLVNSIKSRKPYVHLHVFERESVANRDSVLSGEVNLGLAYDPEPSSALEITPLLVESLYVVGPAKCAERAISYPIRYDVHEVASLPLILPGPQHGYRKALARGLRNTGLTPNIALEVHGLAAVASFVQRGAGFALSTYAAMQHSIEEGELVPIEIGSDRFEVTLCAVQRRADLNEERQGVLRAALDETLADLTRLPPGCRRR
jgi:LysR family transcriptional regulator, nitrogen assimilation regulatory protein